MAERAKSALEEMSTTGKFIRTASVYTHTIEEGGRFPPEAGRYKLYISLACPWASRCLAVRNMKGLQDTIQVFVCHPTWQRTRPDDKDDKHHGWAFFPEDHEPVSNQDGHGKFPCTECVVDPEHPEWKFVRDIYEADGDRQKKYTVPVLWDEKEKCIVNNESSQIIRILTSAFNKFSSAPELDLYPEELREKIDDVNKWVYESINDGVYKCGFAKSQRAYEEAFEELFAGLDRAEEVLSKSRYLVGDRLTEADIRLFVTLVRFDEVYVVYFKTNKKCLREYPNLWAYTRDIYQTPGVKESVSFYHIKTHYYTSHPALNTFAIVPRGPGLDFDAPHGRAEQFSK